MASNPPLHRIPAPRPRTEPRRAHLVLAGLLLFLHLAAVNLHAQVAPASTDVWVNTKTGVYHCKGTRYYGKTKQGIHLPERDAQAKGYRPAHGRVCSLEAALLSTIRVWVNTGSGVYHCPGSKYYGKTKAGSFMPEGDALRAGHHPSGGRACASR